MTPIQFEIESTSSSASLLMQALKRLGSQRLPTQSDNLRATLRYCYGPRCRAVRKVIKRRLGWHGRWSAEGRDLLDPWRVSQSQNWEGAP